MSEDVQIGRVEMARDIEAIAPLTKALPTIFDASDAQVVIVDGPFGDGLPAQNLRVVDRDGDEKKSGQSDPSPSDAMGTKVDPEDGDLSKNEKKAKISNPDVDRLQMCDSKLMAFQLVEILFRWRSLRHRVIIHYS